MKHRHGIILFVLALAFALLAGCSGSNGDNADGEGPGNETPPKVETPQAPPQPVELVFYSCGNTSPDAFDALYGDAIRAKYPHFTLNYISGLSASRANELIPNMLLSNTVDINFDSIGNIPACLLRFGLDSDMSDVVRSLNFDLSRLEPNAVQGIRDLNQGKLSGIPVFNNTRVMYYNKDLFEKFGVNEPTDQMSWDEALELGRRMTRVDDGVAYLGVFTNDVHQIRMNALSIPILDPSTGKPTINTDPRWVTVITKGFIEPYNSQAAQSMITSALPGTNLFVRDQRGAMMLGLANQATDQQATFEQVNWDMVTEPYYTEAPNISSQVYPTYFSVTSQSKNREAALQAISVLVSDEHQMFLSGLGQIPVVENDAIKSALGSQGVFSDKNWGAVFLNSPAQIPPKSPYDIEVEVIYRKNLRALAQGNMDLNTLLRTAQEEAEAFLEAEARK